MKSARRDKAEGTGDMIAGHVVEAFGDVTGHPLARDNGKAARGRGAGRPFQGGVMPGGN